MIYRILVDDPNRVARFRRSPDGDLPAPPPLAAGRWPRTLQGAGWPLGSTMDRHGLCLPDLSNPRARCYFTERGWEEVGRHVADAGRREGRVVKVIRRKNPAPSQIVYADSLQVAILPRRSPRTRRR